MLQMPFSAVSPNSLYLFRFMSPPTVFYLSGGCFNISLMYLMLQFYAQYTTVCSVHSGNQCVTCPYAGGDLLALLSKTGLGRGNNSVMAVSATTPFLACRLFFPRCVLAL